MGIAPLTRRHRPGSKADTFKTTTDERHRLQVQSRSGLPDQTASQPDSYHSRSELIPSSLLQVSNFTPDSNHKKSQPNHLGRDNPQPATSGKIPNSDSILHESNNGIEKKTPTVKDQTRMRTKAASGALFILVIGSFLLVSFSESCDVDIKIENTVQFCRRGICNSDLLDVKVHKGYKICVRNAEGVIERYNVAEIVTRVAYKKMYDTADYKSTLDYACASCNQREDGGCWGVKGPCDLAAGQKLRENSYIEANSPIFYTCVEASREGFLIKVRSKSFINCHFQEKVTRQGSLHGVYKKTRQDVLVKLTVVGEDPSKKKVLSRSPSSFPCRRARAAVGGEVSISMSVNNYTSQPPPETTLLEYQDRFYYVNAAEEGKPRMGLIGDFQVALDGKESYNLPTPRCEHLNDCVGKCTKGWSFSEISSFLSRDGRYQQPSWVSGRKTNQMVEVEKPLEGEVYIRLRSQKLKRNSR